jgi:hypothetical protein
MAIFSRRPAVSALSFAVFALCAEAALVSCGCAGSSPAPAEPAPATTATTSATVSADPSAAPSAAAPEPSAEILQPEAAGGRMAFIQCPEKRPEMCTHLYKPVCAEVDNGVRCIKAPCPSSDKKDYPNACSACSDKKVLGHWPVACADLGADAK